VVPLSEDSMHKYVMLICGFPFCDLVKLFACQGSIYKVRSPGGGGWRKCTGLRTYALVSGQSTFHS